MAYWTEIYYLKINVTSDRGAMTYGLSRHLADAVISTGIEKEAGY